MARMIYIYDDGYHNNTHVMAALHAVSYSSAQFCTSSMILDGCLSNARLIIMPGGADLYYCEKLNGHGNTLIQNFVYNGGAYLGLCAGAYYACSTLDWACGEITGTRELVLYDGCATGPIYEWIENPDSVYNGSWIKAVEIETQDGLQFLTHYNGGPIFQNNNSSDIIARYNTLDNKPAAIIGGAFGQGRYVLSSPHIELFGHLLSDRLYRHLNKSYDREKVEIDKLLCHEQAQKDFFRMIINRLY